MIKIEKLLVEALNNNADKKFKIAIGELDSAEKTLKSMLVDSSDATKEIIQSFIVHINVLQKQLIKLNKQESEIHQRMQHEATAETGWGEWRTKESDQPHADGI